MDSIFCKTKTSLNQPKTLRIRGHYLLAVSGKGVQIDELTPVRFVKYDACPAFVILEIPTGLRKRWVREDLRAYPDTSRVEA